MRARAQPCAALCHAEPGLVRGTSASRLGGLPTITGAHAWPSVDGRPLSFVGEIDLAEVRAVYCPGWLPEGGKLHFFYDMVESPWGFDPADGGHWAVLYSPDPVTPSEMAAPVGLSTDLVFPQVDLVAIAATSHPDPMLLDEELGRLANLPESEWQRIEDFRSNGEHYPLHQVGGYPSPIQTPAIGLECQLASHGIYLGNPEAYATPEAAALAPGAADWRLLLQVDSDDRAEMMWGDLGRLYFLIREQDARTCDFSRAWLILQCS